MDEAPNPEPHPDASGIGALSYCVVRIEGGVRNSPDRVSHGTGFYYRFAVLDGEVMCIVSNKHVLFQAIDHPDDAHPVYADRPWVQLGVAENVGGRRALAPAKDLRVNHGQLPIIGHPDPDVDLAIMPISPAFELMQQSGFEPFVVNLALSNHIPAELVGMLSISTDVLMIGFPNGLMDEMNNLPVARRGSLATPYAADFRGSPNFVVDIAAFGGSSGSPVFAYFNGMVPTVDGATQMGGSAAYLIGVLHAGPVLSAEGKIVQRPVPTEHVAITQQMIHLGYCAKIALLDDFLPILTRLVQAQS